MSTGNALQSTSTTTTTSQITGKRKRVDSADGVENVKENQEDEKRKEGIHDFLADVVELLRRLVTDFIGSLYQNYTLTPHHLFTQS